MVIDRRAGLGHATENGPRMIEELKTRGSRLDSLGPAVQKRQAKLVLEPGDLLRQRRLGYIDLLGRTTEAAMADDRRQIFELP